MEVIHILLVFNGVCEVSSSRQRDEHMQSPGNLQEGLGVSEGTADIKWCWSLGTWDCRQKRAG